MIEYIKTVLPKILKFSESLNRTYILVDQPWVIIEDDGKFEKLIFKKNNELIMSSDGKVSTGKWEYISGANSILIDRVKDKILLNQEFVEEGLLILKYDGFSDKFFILANENIVPDLNIEGYLQNIFYRKYNIVKVEATDNQIYEISRNSRKALVGMVGQSVFQNMNRINDCIFQSKESNIIYHVKNSEICRKSTVFPLYLRDGRKIFIESFFTGKAPFNNYNTGDIVRLSEKRSDIAPDGVYKIKMFKKIVVKNGVIIS